MKKTQRPTPSQSPDDRPPALPPEWQPTIDAFLEFHRVHRGVSAATVDHYRKFLGRFIAHVSPQDASVAPDRIEPRHIDSFLLLGRKLGRGWARSAASMLRVFLRYLTLLGYVPAELATQVPSPRTYRLARLPRALETDELRRVLHSVERRREPAGRREYAILLVFATYGLRVGDVAALRLDDVHWREGTITLQLSKTGKPHALPLTGPVGSALADYLQHGRPRCDQREVFLSVQRPFLPLTEDYISQLVRRAMDRAGVKLRNVATHAFRHGFATRLIRNGVALDTIADCLGHASSATTLIYTKLAVEDLRAVSLDPREVLS